MGVSGQCFSLASLSQGKRPATHCAGDWVASRAGMDRCWNSRSNLDSTQDRPTGSESL